MNKKGSTHVDWAISMGIFLTYVLSMFILIQPGIEPIQKNDQLIDIVEKNMMDDIEVSIAKMPVKLINVAGNAIVTLNGELPFKRENNFASMSTDDLTLYSATAGYDGGEYLTSITFHTSAASELVYILESDKDDFVFDVSTIEGGTPVTLPEDLPPDPEKTFRLGAAEVIKGTSRDKIDNLCSDDMNADAYEAQLDKWGFPINKRFLIRVKYDKNDEYENKCFFEEPYDGANVFVKEIKVPVISETAEIEEYVTINMMVW